MKSKIIGGLVVLLGLFLIIPYFVPLSKPPEEPVKAPYLQSEYFTYENVTLHYREFEPVDAPVQGQILLVHGLGGSTDSFRHNFGPLAEAGYRVVAVDLPGFGYSERNIGFNHHQSSRAAMLWELIAYLSEDQTPWHLVGHSMGGGTVAAMAAAAPQRTHKVVLVGGALGDNSPIPGTLLKMPPLGRWIQILLERVVITEERIESYLASAYGRPALDVEVEAFLEPLEMPGTAYSALGLLETSGSLPEEALKPLKVPVVGIWGEEDTWVSLEEGRALGEVFEDYTLHVIPGAAHCPMETHEATFNRLLLEALKVENEEAME